MVIKMKNILITGARSGIMTAVIKKLINKKYHIYVTVHTEEQLRSVINKYSHYENITCLKLDVTNKEDYKKIENIDIDIFIANAAIGMSGSISELPIEKLREVFETNVFSNFQLIQYILKKMIKKDSGKIIIMSSLAGIIPVNFLGAYSASKASIIKLTETLKCELKLITSKIKIVLVEPGLYKTGFNLFMLESKYDWMEEKSYFKEELEYIRKMENTFIKPFECKNFDSIAKPIVKAIINKNPKFLIRSPFYQVIGAKLYLIFKA